MGCPQVAVRIEDGHCSYTAGRITVVFCLTDDDDRPVGFQYHRLAADPLEQLVGHDAVAAEGWIQRTRLAGPPWTSGRFFLPIPCLTRLTASPSTYAPHPTRGKFREAGYYFIVWPGSGSLNIRHDPEQTESESDACWKFPKEGGARVPAGLVQIRTRQRKRA